mgnify:CR=1 FL=1
MASVVGVRFKKAGKIYYFDPVDIDAAPGTDVIVETSRGIEFGDVVTGRKEIPDEEIVTPLKPVIRIATEEDTARQKENEERAKDAMKECINKIDQHKMDMKIIDAEYTFDNSKIIFYFTADGRVDFRELVKELAAIFKTRIELRQIGVRDEAKSIGGLGPCGRSLCCGCFLGDFEPVSIKMAKDQNLSLNPTKISGLCGRLMCCLKYEQDVYEETRSCLPLEGSIVLTPQGEGRVSEVNVLKKTLKVNIPNDEGIEISYVFKPCEITIIMQPELKEE